MRFESNVQVFVIVIFMIPIVIISPAYASPILIAEIVDEVDGFTELDESNYVTTTTVGSNTYALVTADDDDAVTIIDISTPGSPVLIAEIEDEVDGFTELDGLRGITTTTIGSNTYALVAASGDDAVTIIDISTPGSPVLIAEIEDGQNGFTELDGPRGITTTTIGSNTYALVTGFLDDAVTIIDISTPGSPVLIAEIEDGQNGFTELNGPQDVTTTTIGSNTYALVAGFLDGAVTIIDISTPGSPVLIAEIEDEVNGFTELNGPQDVTTTTIGSNTYALVTSLRDDAVTIIDISTPGSPVLIAEIEDEVNGFAELDGPRGITTTTIGSNTYALVAAFSDGAVTIIDISTPGSPVLIIEIMDEVDGFTKLAGSSGIDVVVLGSKTYVLVSNGFENAVTIIDISTPQPPSNKLRINTSVTDASYDDDIDTIDVNDINNILSTVTIPSDFPNNNDPVVDYGDLVNSNIVSVGTEITTTANQLSPRVSATYSGDISGSGWDGELTMPTVASISDVSVNFSFQFGDPDRSLSFSIPVKLVIFDKAGSRAFITEDGPTTEITVICNSTDRNTVSNIPTDFPQACKIDSGDDLVILTKTASVFSTAESSSSSSSDSSSGHGQTGVGPESSANLHSNKVTKTNCKNFFGTDQSLRVYSIVYDKQNNGKLNINLKTTCGPATVYLISEYGTALAGFSSDQPAELDENNKLRSVSYTGAVDESLKKITIVAKDKRDSFSETIFLNQDIIERNYHHVTGYTSEQVNNVELLKTESTIIEDVRLYTDGQIPYWVKEDLLQWTKHYTREHYFFDTIRYLVDNGHIQYVQWQKSESLRTMESYPDWVIDLSKAYVEDNISEKEFFDAISYLIEERIIRIGM